MEIKSDMSSEEFIEYVKSLRNKLAHAKLTRHREDGPAVEFANHRAEWWINGKLHREDGPAVERTDGKIEWWIEGKQISDEEVTSRQLYISKRQGEEVAAAFQKAGPRQTKTPPVAQFKKGRNL